MFQSFKDCLYSIMSLRTIEKFKLLGEFIQSDGPFTLTSTWIIMRKIKCFYVEVCGSFKNDKEFGNIRNRPHNHVFILFRR